MAFEASHPLHLAVLVFVPGCAVAAWWQINRAEDGNGLSYLYSVMWPVFGILGIVFWWMLIHTDYETVGLKGMQRQPGRMAGVGRDASSSGRRPRHGHGRRGAGRRRSVTATRIPSWRPTTPGLAELAAKGAKTWRNRESVVVRRAR